LQPVGQFLVEALDEKIKLGRRFRNHVLVLFAGLECRAPDKIPPALRIRTEEFHETCDSVRLGENHIDREINFQRLVEFNQPRADRVGVFFQLRLRQGHQILETDRNHDTVDGLTRPGLAQDFQKTEPSFAIVFLI